MESGVIFSGGFPPLETLAHLVAGSNPGQFPDSQVSLFSTGYGNSIWQVFYGLKG